MESSFTINSPSDWNEKIWSGTVYPNEMYIRFNYLDLDLRIYIDQTPCHYGGFRYWFICPSYGRRCGKVYSGKLGLECRECCDLNYLDNRSNFYIFS